MGFWQVWEQAFQAFMVLIGVGIVWLRFIEPLFPSRGVSVTLMLLAGLALSSLKLYFGLRGIRQQIQAAQAQIAASNGQGEEAG
ncbi:MAG: hypothetical protein PHD58_07715 [Anaerolineales bacterium]|nr:hypothetical protein [Anaerolineales bacterium]